MSSEVSALNLSLYPAALGIELRKEYQEGCGKYLAMTAAEPCFILSTLVGAVETVFWAAIFLLAKTIHLFFPSSFETPTLICDRIYKILDSAATLTFYSGLLAVGHFCTDFDD